MTLQGVVAQGARIYMRMYYKHICVADSLHALTGERYSHLNISFVIQCLLGRGCCPFSEGQHM